jgi:hypothetical protein
MTRTWLAAAALSLMAGAANAQSTTSTTTTETTAPAPVYVPAPAVTETTTQRSVNGVVTDQSKTITSSPVVSPYGDTSTVRRTETTTVR